MNGQELIPVLFAFEKQFMSAMEVHRIYLKTERLQRGSILAQMLLALGGERVLTEIFQYGNLHVDDGEVRVYGVFRSIRSDFRRFVVRSYINLSRKEARAGVVADACLYVFALHCFLLTSFHFVATCVQGHIVQFYKELFL